MRFTPGLFLVFLITVVTAQNCEEVDGVRQSPINIRTVTVIPAIATPLKWGDGYYQVPQSMSLVNDGHSLKLSASQSLPPIVSSGVLKVPYEFQQLHFHWGDNDNWGSEHQIDGHTYPLEMHVVHSQTITNNTDQMVVVTYFFRVARHNNRGFQNLLEVAEQAAKNRNVPLNVRPFALAELVSTASFSYYTYKGSLTTPPYTESVTWIIAATAIPISENQLQILRGAANIDQGLKNNFRCLQDINGRQINFIIQNFNSFVLNFE